MNNSGKLSLCVIFGGVSSEHEVSRMSATSILENLSSEKYDVHMVGITKEGKWLLYTGDVKEIVSGAWEQGPVAPAFLAPDPSVHGLVVLRDGTAETIPVDVILPSTAKTAKTAPSRGCSSCRGSPMWAAIPSPPACAWIRRSPTPCFPTRTSSRPITCGSTPTGSTWPPTPLKTKSKPGWTSLYSSSLPMPALR